MYEFSKSDAWTVGSASGRRSGTSPLAFFTSGRDAWWTDVERWKSLCQFPPPHTTFCAIHKETERNQTTFSEHKAVLKKTILSEFSTFASFTHVLHMHSLMQKQQHLEAEVCPEEKHANVSQP